MRGGAELLHDEAKDHEGLSDAIRLIDRGIERIEGIVDHVQELAEGREKSDAQSVKLEALLGSAVEMIRLSQFDLKTELSVECPKSLDLKVDEGRLSQVILNLLLNAVRAVGAAEGSRVDIRGDELSRNGRTGVSIRIGDNGPGVPEELVEKIFEPFVTKTSDDSGTGLGLTISRQMVEAAGGTLELISNDSGAVFEIWLPSD